MSDLGKQLGRRIYEFRKQNRFTQAALAEKARISNEFMSAVERGAKLPSLEVLERVANGLRVEIKDLFNFDRTAFRRVESLSRPTLDLATTLQQLPAEQRQRVLKIIKTLLG
jgi:transcriptional regulator with XRE-family HTH domain